MADGSNHIDEYEELQDEHEALICWETQWDPEPDGGTQFCKRERNGTVCF